MSKTGRRLGFAVLAAVMIVIVGLQGASAEQRRGWDHFNFGVPWEDSYGYSQAARAGNMVYISGQLSHDAAGNFIGEGDFELQVRTAFGNLDKVLAHYRIPRNQIISVKIYTKNLPANFDTAARLHKEYFGRHRPTDTIVGVVDLAFPSSW
ncbi:RidA family protein [Kibdelosporangium philippinense]|uniref:RidA family protein n=1 Tax=Kibdelosporangium philippinense TaxID=211113 RepID=UPI00361A411F